MTRDEHDTDGRRWSHISKAWILLSSWNDREELAALTAAAESVRLENFRQRALIEQQAKELFDEKSLHVATQLCLKAQSDSVLRCAEKVAQQAKEIARLRDSERKLTALEAAGVDNWEGYSDAMQMMEEKEHP